jgi:tetratricopeptide (TPR) repeat protein
VRASYAALVLLLPLLGSCTRPTEADFWTRTTTGPACIGKSKQFESLMAQGTRANLAGQPDAALKLFRQALKEQQTAYPGADNPCTALPRMSLALQLSAAGQYTDADSQFAEAERALQSPGGEMNAREFKAMRARLAHYAGVHLLNQKKYAEAEAKLHEAQEAYLDPEAELISFEALHSDPIQQPVRNRFDANATASPEPERLKVLSANRVQQPSLLGLLEVLRYRAIALRELNRLDESARLTRIAIRLAQGNDLGRPSVLARLLLTSGVTSTAKEGGTADQQVERAQLAALNDYGRSDTAFEAALPKTKPLAEAQVLPRAFAGARWIRCIRSAPARRPT